MSYTPSDGAYPGRNARRQVSAILRVIVLIVTACGTVAVRAGTLRA